MQIGFTLVAHDVATEAGIGAERAIHSLARGQLNKRRRRRLPFEALAINGSQRLIGDNFFSAPRGTIPGARVHLNCISLQRAAACQSGPLLGH